MHELRDGVVCTAPVTPEAIQKLHYPMTQMQACELQLTDPMTHIFADGAEQIHDALSELLNLELRGITHARIVWALLVHDREYEPIYTAPVTLERKRKWLRFDKKEGMPINCPGTLT